MPHAMREDSQILLSYTTSTVKSCEAGVSGTDTSLTRPVIDGLGIRLTLS